MDAKDIRRIKVAQRLAGLSEEDYRALLRERFAVVSCKDLRPGQVSEAVDAIKQAGEPEPARGWKPAQLAILRRYQRALGWDQARLRAEIALAVGAFREDSPTNTQGEFDRIMVVLETALEEYLAATGKPWPRGMEPTYWRARNAGCNRRLRAKVQVLWRDLQPTLAEEHRTERYLCEMAEQATGRPCRGLAGIQAYQALRLIEALKDRLAHERARAGSTPIDREAMAAKCTMSEETRKMAEARMREMGVMPLA